MTRLVASCVKLLAERLTMLVALLAVVNAAMSLLPGDAARAALGPEATSDQIAREEHRLGLDRPWPARFASWLVGLARGDFGSNAHGTPIASVVAAKLPNTLLLGGSALVATAVLASALGAFWALRPRSAAARALSVLCVVVVAAPEFVLGSLAIFVFALWLGVLPAVTIAEHGGPASAAMLVLPVFALSLRQIGWNAQVIRAALRDATGSAAAVAARLDGLSEMRVLASRVAPRVFGAAASSFATTLGPMLGGAVVVEALFNYPGLGSVLIGSIAARDIPSTLAATAVAASVVMAALLLADMTRIWAGLRGRR